MCSKRWVGGARTHTVLLLEHLFRSTAVVVEESRYLEAPTAVATLVALHQLHRWPKKVVASKTSAVV